MDKSSRVLDRKKKGRLYSLGGNEPQRKAYRGRLDRLKTVGTFDLGTEMCVLSEVAKNLNKQIMSGETGLIHPLDLSYKSFKTASVTSSISLSVQNSKRNTPKVRKREFDSETHYSPFYIESPSHETKSNMEFKTQHSADDCILKSKWVNCSEGKTRSLSTSSFLDRHHLDQYYPQNLITKEIDNFRLNVPTKEIVKSPPFKTPLSYVDIDTESKKIEEDISSFEIFNKNEDSQGTSFKNRKAMLRKSHRLVKTDSEIINEGICYDKTEIILRSNSEFEVHANPESATEKRELKNKNDRNGSIACSAFSRRDSSDLDDLYFHKMMQKSTDDSSKNPSTDEIDAVFSDSTTDLERLEREYKELIKSNLQREYKSDGDTLDEIGKRRSVFGKWKNQSLEHEFELSNQELVNITGCQTLSSFSNETSGDVKVTSRICSPESFKNGASSDSGLRKQDSKYPSSSQMRSRVYSSSRLGETPIEKERLYQSIPNDSNSLTSPLPIKLTDSTKTLSSRPSVLEIKPVTQTKYNDESSKGSLFEKPFGKFKKVNKLLKCKRFSTSTLYDRKKNDETKGQDHAIHSLEVKGKVKNNEQLEKRGAIHLSKLSLFNQKQGRCSIFPTRKLGIFPNSSRSNNELYSKTTSKAKLSELSKSNTEISKSKGSPRFCTRKSSKSKTTSSSICVNTEPICQSPLSEEFYNKTGSVRLSAIELYEKFCSEDFSGLYKHEQFKNDERKDGSYLNQHECRLEKKGLRVIGRYNKNAMLFKQKSEPKFNFRPNPGNDYYQEEEEYYYNRGDKEYYNEQDEYYCEYEDEYGEEVEGDYYEVGEGDYYEDEVNLGDSVTDPQIIDGSTNAHSQIEINPDHDGSKNVQSDNKNEEKFLEISTGGDSDVDEIYLMPEEPKITDYEICGFENKQFTLEQSIIGRMCNKNISLDYLNTFDEYDLRKDLKRMKSFDSLRDEKGEDILTIYKIYSRDSIVRESELSKQQEGESLAAKCESRQPSVFDYVKLTQSDAAIEPASKRTDFTHVEQSGSIELLSNSSETIRTYSNLTEYAFDTVKNLNMDSCSTSKLSLSLRSEVFDDFTITPDDFRPIKNCEFEDFTLTPDGSLSESYEKPSDIPVDKIAEGYKRDSENECENRVVPIANKFFKNESQFSFSTENKRTQPNLDLPSTGSEIPENNQRVPSEAVGGFFQDQQHDSHDVTLSEFTVIDLYDDDEQTISLFTSELTKEFDRLFSKAEEFVQSSCSCTTAGNPGRSEIPSRFSMHQLEPYYIADLDESQEKNISKDYTNIENACTAPPAKSHLSKYRLKKHRSKSLNNLNRKTKCFPL